MYYLTESEALTGMDSASLSLPLKHKHIEMFQENKCFRKHLRKGTNGFRK